MTDGRSATARRFRDLYQDIATDLCGIDQLSEGQKQLARRAAMLSAESERMEALGVPRDGERGALVWFLRGETVRALGPEHATTDGGRDFLKEVQGGYRLRPC